MGKSYTLRQAQLKFRKESFVAASGVIQQIQETSSMPGKPVPSIGQLKALERKFERKRVKPLTK